MTDSSVLVAIYTSDTSFNDHMAYSILFYIVFRMCACIIFLFCCTRLWASPETAASYHKIEVVSELSYYKDKCYKQLWL